MARKKRKEKETMGARPARTIENANEPPKVQSAKVTDTGAGSDLIGFWRDMQQDLGEQITSIMEKQHRFYQDFNDRWTKVSSDMSETLGEATMESAQLDDIKQTWDKYAQRMNSRLEEFMRTENEAFEPLNEMWKALSDDMGKTVMSLGNVTDMRKAQERLLMTWTEISREMTRQMARSIEMGNGEFKALRDTWITMVEKMDSHARDLVEREPGLQEKFRGWTNGSKDLNKHIMDQLDSTTEDLTKLQTVWTHSMSNITAEFLRSMWNMNMKWFEENANKTMKRKE